MGNASFCIFAIIVVVLASAIAIFSSKRKKIRLDGYYPILDLSKFWSLVIIWIVAGLIIGLGYVEGSPFIYFAF